MASSRLTVDESSLTQRIAMSRQEMKKHGSLKTVPNTSCNRAALSKCLIVLYSILPCDYQKPDFTSRARKFTVRLTPQSYRPHHTRLQLDASSSLRQDLWGQRRHLYMFRIGNTWLRHTLLRLLLARSDDAAHPPAAV